MKRICQVVALVLVIALTMSTAAFAAPKKLLYVALGDSIAQGTGLENYNVACYGAIVAKTNGYDFKNQAFAGHQTADMLKDLSKADVAADVKKANIISISIGGNDFILGGMYKIMFDAWVCKDYDYMDEIIAKVYDNFCDIIAKVRKLNPKALLLVQTLYNPETGMKKEIYQTGLNKLNACYTRYLKEHPGSYVIVDAASVVKADEKMIAKDNIHPNAKGHVAIAKAYLKTLKKLKYGTKTEPVIVEPGKDINGMLMLRFMMPMFYLYTSISDKPIQLPE